MTRNMPVYLIVNADDYGYYRCVSRGILDLARGKHLMATAIMANSPIFNEQAALLHSIPDLDIGVHLNLTYGAPLTEILAARLSANGGLFSGKASMALDILLQKIDVTIVESEWRAQIAKCIEAGLTIQFLNSHEHIHMLPPLLKILQGLAEEFSIAHIRYPKAEWSWPITPGSAIRNIALGTLGILNNVSRLPTPRFIGLAQSGRISFGYLEKLFSSLIPNNTYELMCHPGHFDPNEIHDPALLSYHQWEQELAVLASQEVKDLYDDLNIQLVRYRDLA